MKKQTRRRWLLRLQTGLLLALLLYLVVLYALTPSIENIQKTRHDEPAHLVSSDGRLLAEYYWVNRQWVPLKHIAPAVVDALIATEDHRFYQHFGLDWQRTLASLVHTLAGRRQGGSTITQQLARNLFPKEIGRARTLTRKLKEAITAFKIEAHYSKDEILEIYLNTVPFLYNAWGIEMAARTYFDQHASQLTLLESATLIGMLKGSSYYNPVLHPERAESRRNTVLAQMKKRGKLTAEEYATLSGTPLEIRFAQQKNPAGLAPHLAQHLHSTLIEWADRHGYSLYFDGLVIRTTIHGQLQETANLALQREGALRASALTVDPRNGNVTAWVGPKEEQGGHAALIQRTASLIQGKLRFLTHIEDRHGNVLETFPTSTTTVPRTDEDTLQGDGWMVVLHPQLVVGVCWEPPEHSALPIVGKLFQRAQQTQLINLPLPPSIAHVAPPSELPEIPSDMPLRPLEAIEWQSNPIAEPLFHTP